MREISVCNHHKEKMKIDHGVCSVTKMKRHLTLTIVSYQVTCGFSAFLMHIGDKEKKTQSSNHGLRASHQASGQAAGVCVCVDVFVDVLVLTCVCHMDLVSGRTVTANTARERKGGNGK